MVMPLRVMSNPTDPPEETEASFTTKDVREIESRWRKEWSDRSRSEMVASKGPGFFLWRSKADGLRSSGMFYTSALVDDVISNPQMAVHVKNLIDEIDHQRQLVVVLGFEDESRAIAIVVDELNPPREQAWFEMREVRRRSLANAVWVPVRVSQKLCSNRRSGHEGFSEEFYGANSVMFPVQLHEETLKLGWMEIGLTNDFTGGPVTTYRNPDTHVDTKTALSFKLPGSKLTFRMQVDVPCSSVEEETAYLPSGSYSSYRNKAVGVGLVINQSFNAVDQPVWHLNQDFVVALGLKREGDTWVRPEEGYVEVARLTRDKDDRPTLLEVRSEQLRDYLCARGMNLYASSYRSRVEVYASKGHIDWSPLPRIEKEELASWEGRVTEIHEGGAPYGATTAVFHVSRTDVDDEEDVPIFDLPTDEKVHADSWTTQATGRKLYRISGELWRTEVIEAGEISERVLRQSPTTRVTFTVDAAGNQETAERLEDSRRWLWFRPHVIDAILRYRNSSLDWYTRDTGSITLSPGYGLHFGINAVGLVNVYAKDVAILPSWQQRIWAGFNVGPSGKVSKELLDSQMRAQPSPTEAPEDYLRRAYDAANGECSRLTGRRLFRAHQAIDVLFLRAHRFRALDRSGLFELAKDLARLTVESIDRNSLSNIVEPAPGEVWGSIRHLEKALSTVLDESEARSVTSVLVGVNELRQADAHMPSGDLENSIALAGISAQGNTLEEARQMLNGLVETLFKIADTFAKI